MEIRETAGSKEKYVFTGWGLGGYPGGIFGGGGRSNQLKDLLPL